MKKITVLILMLLVAGSFITAQNKIEISAGADLVSKYVWRGMDFGNSPAVQPSLSMTAGGFEAGFWSSYATNESAKSADELDFYMSYTFDFKTASLTAMVTDYYFPNGGNKLGNFNNHDNEDGAGAHTFEAGASLSFENFPLIFSAYYNFYNDAGNNSYFQLDMPFNIKDYEVNLFCGATPGSKKNPNYYGATSFSIISLGVQATKSVKITENFSLPVFVAYSINPKIENSYLVFGISL